MTLVDYAALSPYLILFLFALVILLVESFSEKAKEISFYLVLTAFTISFGAVLIAPVSQNSLLTPWIKFDALTQLFSCFFLIIGFMAACLGKTFFKQFEATEGEYYFLLISAILGLMFIGASADFLMLFIGIETLSIALYVMCGYMKRWKLSHESSMKYFLLGSLASAFLLYGIALIYGALGTTQFSVLLKGYQALHGTEQLLFFVGVAFVTFGLAFEAAIVPFHIWAPDVYDGAPTPVTALMSVGTKVGAFAAFIRVFLDSLPNFHPVWNEGIALLAYPTLIYANFVALQQTSLRRFFAYSGISHAGFLLLPLAAGGPQAISSMLFYLAIYGIATLAAFAVLACVDRGEKSVEIKDVSGLFYQSPWLAILLTLSMLTLAGIPPTAGFFAKFYVFKLAFEARYYGLVVVGLLTTILAAYYYLRIIGTLFVSARENVSNQLWPALLVGGLTFVFIVAFSFYPPPLLSLLNY